MPDINVFLVSLSERRVFYSRKNSTSILPNLKKLVLGRHSSFYVYMNIDLATQVVIGHNFFLSSAWTGDDGQPRKYLVRQKNMDGGRRSTPEDNFVPPGMYPTNIQ
jgi:hypothetical protein